MIEEDDKTLWCGNLPEQVSEEILYELFLQAGPLEKVRIPKDRDGRQKNFAFITFCHEVSVPYAIKLFRGTSLFHKTLTLQFRGRMVPLPPPIRCVGPEVTLDFGAQTNIAQQFADMTRQINDNVRSTVQSPRQFTDMRDMIMASLQGNWTHRHHPYRPQDMPHRENQRSREHRSSYSNYSNNWRDRRNHKRSNAYEKR